jgi:hypothetical protein
MTTAERQAPCRAKSRGYQSIPGVKLDRNAEGWVKALHEVAATLTSARHRFRSDIQFTGWLYSLAGSVLDLDKSIKARLILPVPTSGRRRKPQSRAPRTSAAGSRQPMKPSTRDQTP